MPVTYTPINKCAPGMWPMNYAARLVKGATDVMFAIGTDDRKGARARLDDLEVSIKMLRESLNQMAIADETAAGIPDD
ncbi:hypothetical protein ACM7LV_27250 [Pseudomonas aeruginosa]|uniref:Uncharacterized protein n=1 Tax=Pseudomonas aeruginosa TaxID=287 RepID=A0A9P1VXR4_PSEAI|nr:MULTISPECIES: hypothetical protein [Pseudomonas]KFF32510.1 hypothetical protein G039_0333595 [Pseudomonas aeruginosa VRFPA01]SCZ06682.1 Uncharacterised protein [Acinetobacter baumannii]EKX7258089.1 hypothetical protein [Pseudomonas aeruginosa]ELG7182577.1 hypothetical protein [Pseudomonas aeruginosa]ELI0480873.1 hypothetical protein [Pseudomonas aeruginosa]